jgi:hypothetical protein
VNPALTIMANALRVGDHLLQRLAVSTTTYAATTNGVSKAEPVAR